MFRLGLLVLALLYISQWEVKNAEAKHIKTSLIKNNDHHMNDVSPHHKGGGQEPTLFDLLMAALSDTEMMEEEAARRKQVEDAQAQQGTKPCYWSLVSCYRKKK